MSRSENDRLEPENEQKLVTIKDWIETRQVETKEITDEFIIIFLRSCDFDVKQTKKTLSIHFENRKKIPQWWTNRALDDPVMASLIQKRFGAILEDKSPGFPTVIISQFSREKVGYDKQMFDPIIKLGLIIGETLMYRPNCQMNGLAWILDCRDIPWWLPYQGMTPTCLKNIANSYFLGMPIKVKKLIVINASGIVYVFYKLLKPFLPKYIADSIHVLGFDLSSLPNLLPLHLLPDEHGGEAGPMRIHEDFFFKEVNAHAEYFADDANYGYC